MFVSEVKRDTAGQPIDAYVEHCEVFNAFFAPWAFTLKEFGSPPCSVGTAG
jgi:hypothetical protein